MSTPKTTIIVHGASGRMGARLCTLAFEDREMSLFGAIVREGDARLGREVAPGSSSDARYFSAESQKISAGCCEVVIDFSSDEGARQAARIAASARAALLVGTTALSSTTIDALKKLSTMTAVLVAPNTSLGVAVLAALARSAAAALGGGYHCSIVEAHHALKKDAPSGTARRLADAVREAGHELPESQMLAVRGGDVIGEHTIRFAGQGEYLELTHRATTRDLFARGALRAAKWLRARGPGWYAIEDTLDSPL